MKAAALCAALCAAGLVACSGILDPGGDSPPSLPGRSALHQVVSAVERGPYLDALLARGDRQVRYFFPRTEACRRAILTEKLVELSAAGPIGRVGSGGESCEPVGIGSLARWRDRRPRATRRPLPRGQATFEVIHRDEDYVLARGRFPLAGQVGWAGGYDTVAVIPHTPACRAALEGGVASIEFRQEGPDAYRLVSDAGVCPVDGFARPPDAIPRPAP